MEQKENGDANYGGKPRVTDKRGQNKRVEESVAAVGAEGTLTAEALTLLEAQALADDSTPVVPDKKPVLAAFVVILDHEGNVQASSELEILEQVTTARPATFGDMYSAASHIQKDIQSQETTLRIMGGLAQQAAVAQQAAMAQKIQGQMMVPRR